MRMMTGSKALHAIAVKAFAILIPAMLLFWAALPAASQRPITRVYSLELGARDAYASYLAPTAYSGFALGLSGHFSKLMPFAPEKAMMSFRGSISFMPSMLNKSKYASMMGLEADFSWTIMGFARLPHNIRIGGGGGVDLDAGGLALLKNSNNPAIPILDAGVCAEVFADWDFNIRRLPMKLSVNLRAPLLGAFFMMGYGETYYEIFVGNHCGIVHCGWPGNHQKFDLNTTLQMKLGNAGLEVGYRMRFNRATANNLCYRTLDNFFTVALIKY